MAIALWQDLDEDDICCDCGAFPANKQCKICYEPLCPSCSRKNHGKCSECLDDDKEYDDND